jgi:bleomycin hydrolase
MKTVLLALLGALLFHLPAAAQTRLTPDLLRDLERSCPKSAQLTAAQNTLAQVDGNKITQDWNTITGVDQHFSLRLKDQKITDQKGTGRCWMFSGLNVLRPAAAGKLGAADIELSQAYLYFYEKLEKANLFLDAVVQSKDKTYTDRTVEFLCKQTVRDGQNWTGFVELVDKYGVVPKEVMPETYSSSNSGHVNAVLSRLLKRVAVKIRQEPSAEAVGRLRMQAMKDVYRILAINFGFPPATFDWRYETTDKKLVTLKNTTPQKFYRDYVGTVLQDYYPLYSIPTLAFNKKYEIALNRTLSDQPDLAFVNVPLETPKDLAKRSLLDSNAVWFGCDVGQESNSENGLMVPNLYDYASLYGMDFTMTRRELFETYSTTPTHNMVFTGIDIVDGKVKKWLVENSWGEARGRKGYFTMLDEWFDSYVQEVVVHKRYIPQEIVALYKTQALVLPPWDPMTWSVTGF